MRHIVGFRRPWRWGAFTLFGAAVGCGEDPTSPSIPGPDGMQEATAAQALSFIQMSAGSAHTCGVTSSNQAYCWGSNPSGQLGDGTHDRRLTPVAVAGNLRFLRVSAGDKHTCGITTTYRAYCWGYNGGGALGDGTTVVYRTTPTAVAGNHSFRQVTVGPGYTCAVTRWDVAFCWGNNESGRLGIGTNEWFRLKPTRVAGGLRFRQVIAGGLHVCGATVDYRAYCWGYTVAFGVRTPDLTAGRPVAIAGGLRFRMVVAGGGRVLIPSEEHEGGTTCGLTTVNLAYCWGSIPGSGFSETPRQVPGGHRFRGINLSDLHACAVTFEDVAFCWGYNYYGQVGDGTTLDRSQPVRVAGGLRFKAVTANTYSYHSCGVTTSNRGYCWGQNGGKIGDGTTTNRLTPAAVAAPM